MLGNCTILDEAKFNQEAKLVGRKPAKLSTFDKFRSNVIKNRMRSKTEENSLETEKKQEVSKSVSVEAKQEVPVQTEVKVASEIVKDSNIIQLPSKEVLTAKAQKLDITCYNDLPASIINLNSYRRLRVAALVKNILLHTKKVIATSSSVNMKPEVKEENKETFDFSQVSNINLTNQTSNLPTDLKEQVKTNTDIDVRLDEFLNKNINIKEQEVSSTQEQTDDKIMNEINSLVKENTNIRDLIATQKEKLANLRQRIEQNQVLCEAKREELRQENMALTQELNDILDQINQSNDINNQQEAFLGINNEHEEERISKAA